MRSRPTAGLSPHGSCDGPVDACGSLAAVAQ
jgi:hypothetical protein